MERRSTGLNFRKGISLTCVLLVAGIGTAALAQEPVAPPAATAQAQPLAPQQLDNLVAPIALYPDPLLGQVLAASTYPVELVEAQQWLQANRGLQGQQLSDAARQQNWDASIQAMVAMPDVLAKLNQDIRWSTDLGNAFLAQPADVMAAVQRLRERAQSNGRLQSSPQETVSTQNQNGQQAIVIQPADPQVIYVPTYDPAYIWGAPLWGAYPSLYYPTYGFGFYPGYNIGLYFGGWGGWGRGGWGWGPNWFGGGLFVNSAFFSHYGYHYGYGFGRGFGNVAWAHDAAHRVGVGYPNAALANRYGAASQASRMNSVRAGNYRNASPATGSRQSFGGGAQGAGRSQGFAAGRQPYQAQGAGRSQGFAAGRQSYQAQGAGRSQGFAAGRQSYQAQGAGRSQGFAAGRQSYQAPAAHYSAPSAARSSGGGSYGGSSYSSGGHGGGGSYGGSSYSSGSHGGGSSFGGGSHGGGGGHGGGRR